MTTFPYQPIDCANSYKIRKRFGIEMPPEESRTLRLAGIAIQRESAAQCNGESISSRQDAKAKKSVEQVREICERRGLAAVIQDDPRGACLWIGPLGMTADDCASRGVAF